MRVLPSQGAIHTKILLFIAMIFSNLSTLYPPNQAIYLTANVNAFITKGVRYIINSASSNSRSSSVIRKPLTPWWRPSRRTSSRSFLEVNSKVMHWAGWSCGGLFRAFDQGHQCQLRAEATQLPEQAVSSDVTRFESRRAHTFNIDHRVMSLGAGDCPFPIIPWSEVPFMEFMGLWHRDQGSGVPWCQQCRGHRGGNPGTATLGMTHQTTK